MATAALRPYTVSMGSDTPATSRVHLQHEGGAVAAEQEKRGGDIRSPHAVCLDGLCLRLESQIHTNQDCA